MHGRTLRAVATRGKRMFGGQMTRKEQIVASLQNFTFELTPQTARKLLAPEAAPKKTHRQVLAQLRELADNGTAYVYITKLPAHPQTDTVDAVNLVRDFGFEPIPHIPARGIKNPDDLDQFLTKLACKHVLIVGGSIDEPVGEFSESLQLLETGLLQSHGVETVGLASHPQGADNIPADVLDRAMLDKLRWAKRERAKFKEVYWATQLAYSVDAIKGWERGLRLDASDPADKNDLRINLGLPGPATTTQLIKYAAMSGIASSVNYFKNNPVAAWSLLTKRSVLDELVSEISGYIQEDEAQKIGGFHFFTFGSLNKTLDWACKVRAGNFELDSNGQIVPEA